LALTSSFNDAIIHGGHVDVLIVDGGAKLSGNGPGAVYTMGTGVPVRHQRVVAVQCSAAQTNRLDEVGNRVDNLYLSRQRARRVVVLTVFPPTPLALPRPSPRQLSPTKAPSGVLGHPIDDAVEAAALVERPATVLVRYVVPRYPAAARSQRPAASLPVHSHSSRTSNRCPRSVGRAAGRRDSV